MPHCQSWDCNHCNPAHKCVCGTKGRGDEVMKFAIPESDRFIYLCSGCLRDRLNDLLEFVQRLRNAHDGVGNEEESEVFAEIEQALARAKADK